MIIDLVSNGDKIIRYQIFDNKHHFNKNYYEIFSDTFHNIGYVLMPLGFSSSLTLRTNIIIDLNFYKKGNNGMVDGILYTLLRKEKIKKIYDNII